MTTKYDIFARKQLQADRCICLAAKRTGKPYEGKPHVRFDEKMLEIGYGCDIVTLSEETESNGEYKYQPVATTPVFYSTIYLTRAGMHAGNLRQNTRLKGISRC